MVCRNKTVLLQYNWGFWAFNVLCVSLLRDVLTSSFVLRCHGCLYETPFTDWAWWKNSGFLAMQITTRSRQHWYHAFIQLFMFGAAIASAIVRGDDDAALCSEWLSWSVWYFAQEGLSSFVVVIPLLEYSHDKRRFSEKEPIKKQSR